jgi:ribosomal protein S27E
MPLLKIRCQKCGAVISTGMDMSYETYRSATLTDHVIECPNCDHTQAWTVDDIDKSVFAPFKK